MTKSNLKKKMASMAAKVGVKQTQNDFNQACVMFIYQPKQPRALKKRYRIRTYFRVDTTN